MNLPSSAEIEALLDPLASEIPANPLVGIHTGGVWVAEALAQRTGQPVLGTLGIALHRDDFDTRGLAGRSDSSLPPIDGQNLILVDDIIQSGRTIRAALNELFEFGRPARVDLLTLFDVGQRELPIEPTFFGARLAKPNQGRYKLARDPLRLESHGGNP